MESGLNISQLAKYFSDEDAARALLEEMRWGKDGAVCPHCGGDQPYKITPKPGSKTRKGLYKCRACRKQFTVTVGTVFEDSHIPISKWLLALHLLASSKKGMSAHQLHRNLGISYKGAWFMAHRLRYAMAQGPLESLLKGTVEIDETYVGGRRKGTQGRPAALSHKTPVVALVERGSGRVRAFPMARVTADNLGKAIEANIAHNATMMTDELNVYRLVAEAADRKHVSVNHSKEEYVRGAAHTNTVEGFFSLLKRGIREPQDQRRRSLRFDRQGR
jgi:transposase-like protein